MRYSSRVEYIRHDIVSRPNRHPDECLNCIIILEICSTNGMNMNVSLSTYKTATEIIIWRIFLFSNCPSDEFHFIIYFLLNSRNLYLLLRNENNELF